MENINKKEILQEIKSYIQKIYVNKEDILESIREYNDIQALTDILDGLNYCIRGISITKDNNIEIDEEKFKHNIEEILSAVENKDYNLVCDIFEYEIIDMIESLNENLQNI